MRYLALSSMLILALAATAPADWVEQGTDDYVAFEAESSAVEFDDPGFVVIDTTTTPPAPALSSGGAGLWFTGETIGVNEQYDASRDNDQGQEGDYVASYSLEFAQTGTYTLYLRKYVGDSDAGTLNDGIAEDKNTVNGNDALWVLSDWDLDVRDVASYGSAQGGAEDPPALAWYNVGDFTVSEAQVGQQLGHALSIREDGLMVDRLIFVLQGSDVDTSDSGLDALANSQIVPEPTTMALLGLGSLVAVRRRRR